MKLNTQQITAILPVSPHTVIRYQKESPGFPEPERIGRTNYFEEADFFKWLNGRATRNGEVVPSNTIRTVDKILSTVQAGEKLNRSNAWLWKHLIKNPAITLIDLSPSGNSQNPRRYFIEREVLSEFPTLAELVEGAA